MDTAFLHARDLAMFQMLSDGNLRLLLPAQPMVRDEGIGGPSAPEVCMLLLYLQLWKVSLVRNTNWRGQQSQMFETPFGKIATVPSAELFNASSFGISLWTALIYNHLLLFLNSMHFEMINSLLELLIPWSGSCSSDSGRHHLCVLDMKVASSNM